MNIAACVHSVAADGYDPLNSLHRLGIMSSQSKPGDVPQSGMQS